MLEDYLKELDDFVMTADEIIDVEVIRRSIWDTDLEKLGLYRYRIRFCDGSLLELTERLLEENKSLTATKYRFHWQNKEGVLIKRWDNARHHSKIETFPHHLHDGSEENVTAHKQISGLDVLRLVVKTVGKMLKGNYWAIV